MALALGFHVPGWFLALAVDSSVLPTLSAAQLPHVRSRSPPGATTPANAAFIQISSAFCSKFVSFTQPCTFQPPFLPTVTDLFTRMPRQVYCTHVIIGRPGFEINLPTNPEWKQRYLQWRHSRRGEDSITSLRRSCSPRFWSGVSRQPIHNIVRQRDLNV
jgi:hypothetical protein